MIELESPQIESVEEAGTYAKYEAGPLQAGYGVTLGNALRRLLLSSLRECRNSESRVPECSSRSATRRGVSKMRARRSR